VQELSDMAPHILCPVKGCSNSRTGCPECYGKLNCGCPDCYVPELKRGKKKRASLDLETMLSLPSILELEYSTCTVSQVQEERVTVTKALVRTQEEGKVQRRPISCVVADQVRRSRNRLSLPVMEVTVKEKEKPVRVRHIEPIQAREVGPPKQTKYFCRQCKVDICNACFSTVCSGHTVQWIGSACFHCASPSHRIVHQHTA